VDNFASAAPRRGTLGARGGTDAMVEETPDVAQQEIDKLQQEQESIRVELADEGKKTDPVSSVKNAEFRNLADAYRFHGELLDEQRGQLQGLKEYHDLLKQRLEELAKEIVGWREFQQQERARFENTKPPIENTPLGHGRKPFGGPGW